MAIRLYPGADGSFLLYEDEGDNYQYEKGAYATIAFQWQDSTRTLTIGAQQGSYPGMLKTRQFVIVLPDGTSKTVDYNGQQIEIDLQN